MQSIIYIMITSACVHVYVYMLILRKRSGRIVLISLVSGECEAVGDIHIFLFCISLLLDLRANLMTRFGHEDAEEVMLHLFST